MYNLRNRLFVIYLLPTILLLPAVGIVLIYLIENQLIWPDLSRELIDHVLAIRETSHEFPTLWQDPEVADKFVKRFHPDLEDHLMLVIADGWVVASSIQAEGNGARQQIALPDFDSSAQQIHVQTHFSEDQNEDVLDIWAACLDEQQQVVGYIRLIYPVTTIYGYIFRLRVVIVAVLLVAILLRMGLGLAMSHALANPLENLTSAINAMASGKKAEAVPESGVLEIKTTIHSFNSLSHRLQTLESTRQFLLANLVHEIRRPLGTLNSAIYSLTHGASELPQLRTDLLAGMSSELRRLHRLVDDLGLLYQQNKGSLELEKNPTDMTLWLPPLLSTWRNHAETKGLSWQESLQMSVPPLWIDADRLSQAVGNLLDNAIKFTPKGGTISIATGDAEQTFWIRISDTGEGIHPADLPHIFEPFYRSPHNHPLQEGMGLGLSIAREIVNAHDGTLLVESTANVGSHFTISLPLS